MTKGSERNYILKILEDIDKKGLFVNQVLDDYFYVYEFDKQQRSFISKIVYGTIEQRYYIDFAVNSVSKVKVRKMKPVIKYIIRMTAYQILFMDKVPDHAAINEGVKLTKKRKFFQLTGFVNGVLRSVVREKDTLEEKIDKLKPIEKLSIRYSFDQEMLKYLMKQYDFKVIEKYLMESLKTKATAIRVNQTKTNREQLIKELQPVGLIENGHILKDSLYITEYGKITDLEAFKKGLFQVQDESSTLVGIISNIKEGVKVLDVCAAPGGKATHISDLLNGSGEVVACDISEHKVLKINENIQRLGLNNIKTKLLDASIYNKEYNNAFDIVITDVPCSGLGIIRSKPDIKFNMNYSKIESLIELQQKIIQNVSTYVNSGGTLVYSTCTINKEENESQVKKFLDNNNDFELIDISKEIDTYQDIKYPEILKSFINNGMLQLITDEKLTDGFFIAKLRKK